MCDRVGPLRPAFPSQWRKRTRKLMNLNTLLIGENFDPREVIVMRHRPYEPELRKVLPWLATEKPEVFKAYQQTSEDRR